MQDIVDEKDETEPEFVRQEVKKLREIEKINENCTSTYNKIMEAIKRQRDKIGDMNLKQIITDLESQIKKLREEVEESKNNENINKEVKVRQFIFFLSFICSKLRLILVQ